MVAAKTSPPTGAEVLAFSTTLSVLGEAAVLGFHHRR
jgi:hypothetical protein